ncbi:M1-specific T cell receptor beta chain-like isoform X2 [Rhineura floridana]|uniref:M1-specific T cell receptor beta chain-like isoform X2 n=1 Tax=Rhineura floridana TaxID=261503 RepID=UPI002AC85D0C|nr:M1-specific T cell receptor beta chain-like isoform X2 [Rhineura floridana]
MFFHFVAVILLSTHLASSHMSSKTLQSLEQIVTTPGNPVTLNCSLPAGQLFGNLLAYWFKEGKGKRLQQTQVRSVYPEASGHGSSPSDTLRNFPLVISSVQRNHSGLYFCVIYTYADINIPKGVRLIITDVSWPRLSILAPSSLEGAQGNHSMPLLCLLFDAKPSQNPLSWNIRGGMSQNQAHAFGVLNEEGGLSIWSLSLTPPEAWIQGLAHSCSVPENGNVSTALWRGTESTNTGNAKQKAKCILRRKVPQTNYAEVHFNNQNVIQID